ncbi:MAG TPA: CHAP domain-containing protein [Streptosporangiaceae bacterium]
MQGDGNLVLYTASGHALWHSRTGGNPGARTVLQGTDGNLVIYAPNNAVLWAAYTNTHPGDRLCMQSDANLVVYSSSNAALWATMTNHAAAWGQTLSYNPGAAGNCTYWAEYKFHWYTGTYYINTLATSGTTGDAKYWAINASRRGWTVGSVPRMDSIAVWTGGSAGHVAWVTEVWPSQNKIRVSEMNEYGWNVVDSRDISPAFGVSGLQYIYVNARP